MHQGRVADMNQRPLVGSAPSFSRIHDAAASDSEGPQTRPRQRCSQPLQVIGVQTETPVAFSDDGNSLAFVSGNMAIVVLTWQEDRFVVSASLYGHTTNVKCLSFRPGHPHIVASGGADGLFIWDAHSGTALHEINPDTIGHHAHESGVEVLTWTHEGATLVTGSKDTYVQVWDALSKYEHMETISGHKAAVMALCFDPVRLAPRGFPSARAPRSRRPMDALSRSSCLLARGQKQELLATAGRDSTIKIWDASSLSAEERPRRADDTGISCGLQFNVDGHRGDVVSLAFSPDSAILVSGARDNSVKLWDTDNFIELRELRDSQKGRMSEHAGDVRSLHIIRHGEDQVALTASMDSTMRLFRLGDKSVTMEVDLTAITAEEEAAESKRREEEEAKALQMLLASTSVSATEAVAETDDEMLFSIAAHAPNGVASMQYNASRRLAATSSGTNCVRIWNMDQITSPALMQEFVGHSQQVTDVAALPRGNRVVSCSEDYYIHVYDKSSMRLLHEFDFEASALCLALANVGGTTVALVGGSNYVVSAYAMNPELHAPLFTFPDGLRRTPSPHEFVSFQYQGHGGKVRCISVHPDNKHVVTGGEDHSLCLWTLPDSLSALTPDRRDDEVEVLRPLSTILGHSGHVVGVAWSDVSHGEAHLASVGNDHALRIWKLKGHSLSAVHAATPAHDMTVSAVCWGRQQSRDTIFTGGWDRKVLAWDHMDLKSGPIGVLEGHSARVMQVDTTEDGRFLVSAAVDDTVRLWSALAPFNCLCEYQHSEPVMCVAIDDNMFATGAENGMIRFWPYADDEKHTAFFEPYPEDEGHEEVLELVTEDDGMGPPVHGTAAPTMAGAAAGSK